MRTALALTLTVALPLAAARPAGFALPKSDGQRLPDLTLPQWAEIEANVGGHLQDASAWAWAKAEDMVDWVTDDDADADANDNARAQDGDETQMTIWQRLKEDQHSFSRLTGLIEWAGGEAKGVLDDKDAQITFFAPDNNALKPPKKHDGDHDDDDTDAVASLKAILNEESPSLAALSAHYERFGSAALQVDVTKGKGDKKRKKHMEKVLKYIVNQILAYHGLPKAYTVAELGQNSTFETALKAHDGSLGGLHQRVRVEKTLIPPAVRLNFYVKLLATDRKCANGYFHTIDHLLVPPLSTFATLYMLPDHFSGTTSAVQGSHGRYFLEWDINWRNSTRGKPPVFWGTPLATFFAPANVAFATLPPRLKLFLFSPFGRRALAKLLAYHYVPHGLVLSEFQHFDKHPHKHTHHERDHGKRSEIGDAIAEAMDDFDMDFAWLQPPRASAGGGAGDAAAVFDNGDDPSFHQTFWVHTGLCNATLKIEVEKVKVLPIEGAVKTTIKVNDQPVHTIDVPTHNGAFHVITKLLVPPHKHHDHDGLDVAAADSWENWEDWLPAWAEAAELDDAVQWE